MAKSKYEYVKEFETQEKCLPNCWIIVRVDGRGFTKFAEKHRFRKPNDARGLNLMNAAAKGVMKEFPEIILGFGQSDEYSFVLKKETNLYNRRVNKLLSILTSAFTAYYIVYWPKFFGADLLTTPPIFDGRVVCYPSDQNMRDYLSWRQADTHINNLYNTCFWNLVTKKKMTHQEAEEHLKGTVSSDKNELLFSEFGINYNNEPEEFKKGTVIIRGSKKKLESLNVDIIGNTFWEDHRDLLNSNPPEESNKKKEPENVPPAPTS
ncbi:hypothetical protein RUM43_009274 [Polyplax serrata]|uniref:tRNA(His) guanylyltransferase n=1 Tax=Polyplax serrata TaxID=468196 RepID=A0AAN8PCJ5_POLSC